MTAIKVRGPLKIGTDTLRCPGRGERDTPRELTLMANGKTVTATCGQKHRGEDGGRRAQCFFPVEQLTAANLGILAQGKPGRFRLTLTDGTKVEGILAAVGAAAANSTAARAAAAADAKNGKAAKAGPPKPAGRATGGAMTAAFGALAAVATSAGQIATAGASAVESAASLGREGIGVARDGIREAGAYGERRHERKMRAGDDGAGDDGAES
ncbi:hypothetical protein TPA0906_74770 [Streptomyces olivaceus]|uniref:hypothetical protein n=1 Tax=Streptomyces TaxID=1883 RepID=UPI0022ED6977|nr:hypothetical protein [Streptomyces olivaceus]GHJ05612.1 hypothetical protein TPA0906_74770 [Streptomyces olivaceus]